MLKYLSRKLLSGICLLFIVSAVTFVLIFGSTENVARNILGESATAEDIAAYNHQLGIDRPLLVQYGSWLQGALSGE